MCSKAIGLGGWGCWVLCLTRSWAPPPTPLPPHQQPPPPFPTPPLLHPQHDDANPRRHTPGGVCGRARAALGVRAGLRRAPVLQAQEVVLLLRAAVRRGRARLGAAGGAAPRCVGAYLLWAPPCLREMQRGWARAGACACFQWVWTGARRRPTHCSVRMAQRRRERFFLASHPSPHTHPDTRKEAMHWPEGGGGVNPHPLPHAQLSGPPLQTTAAPTQFPQTRPPPCRACPTAPSPARS